MLPSFKFLKQLLQLPSCAKCTHFDERLVPPRQPADFRDRLLFQIEHLNNLTVVGLELFEEFGDQFPSGERVVRTHIVFAR